jgi:membrane fusion protein (multidrug efflux system)
MSTELNNHVSDRLTISSEAEVPIAPARNEPDAGPRQTLSGNGSSSGNSKRKQGRRFVAIASVLVIGAAAWAYYTSRIAPYESTDDATLEGHVIPIAPQVSGRVAKLSIQDNQEVKQGELLLEIDPRDYEARLAQARADLTAANSRLDQARAQLSVDQAKVEQERANIGGAEAQARYAELDWKRNLAIGSNAVSQSQIDLAATQSLAAAAQLEVARNRFLEVQAQVELSKANVETASANVLQSEAAVRQTELNLSYTKVIAPEDGRVTRRTVEAGAFVQPGQALLTIVPHDIWVVANFKETQLTHMRPGQPVSIHVDAYPNQELTGHIDSIQTGSGARFSLFPPENATGNYIKVLQRVPVKIVFNDSSLTELVLGPGMSVEPKVRVK